jgi:hypothetical protein
LVAAPLYCDSLASIERKKGVHLKTAAFLLCGAILLSVLGARQTLSEESQTAKPVYDGSKLVRPEGYREWIYLSSGVGMNYNPTVGGLDRFTNVFVPQWAYHAFLSTGTWPDKTIFALEDRTSESKGSINKSGHFQTALVGLAAEVKDEKRFPDRWAYFNFGGDSKTAEALPKAQCWQCHNDNGAVDHTFVQFYPTLKPIAQQFGTDREGIAFPKTQ